MDGRGRWANAWEIERLEQLRYDLDSALGRLHRECVRCSVAVAPDVAAEWMRRAEMVEEMRAWSKGEIDRWCTNASKGGGCG